MTGQWHFSPHEGKLCSAARVSKAWWLARTYLGFLFYSTAGCKNTCCDAMTEKWTMTEFRIKDLETGHWSRSLDR
jgi:hypothetical protein